MLFTIIVLVIIVTLVVYAIKKTKNEPTNVVGESMPSIHEEIAKTVEETKVQQPIVDEISKTTKAKPAPKMDATPAKKSATKKK